MRVRAETRSVRPWRSATTGRRLTPTRLIPREDIELLGLDDPGMVHVLTGTANGVGAAGNEVLFQSDIEESDHFGAVLA